MSEFKASVINLQAADNVLKFGGKAANLARLMQAGLPVPGGFAVGLEAFNVYGELTGEAKAEARKLIKDGVLYAVRSSALAEDAQGASWAGQFETFLDTKPADVLAKIEECHNSAKERARAYAKAQFDGSKFDIAVVVQEMLNPEYAGVLFTKDPISGADRFVTEYVEGLGEKLVSGLTDPKSLTWQPGEKPNAPFAVDQLSDLAGKAQEIFGTPQDIEWVWADGKIWLVQARPITTLEEVAQPGTETPSLASNATEDRYSLGAPEDLFYWGPSRATPMYMSDFMVAIENFFLQLAADPAMPQPPKSLVLFHESKMVWLSNAADFSNFTKAMFEAYEKIGRLDENIKNWQSSLKRLDSLEGEAFDTELLRAWSYTLFAEFALYGAESALADRLSRFDPRVRQSIWGTFTVLQHGTFLNRIDEELLASGDSQTMAKKYPWIQDGYSGTYDTAAEYFISRLKVLREYDSEASRATPDPKKLAKQAGLTKDDIRALKLTAGLAEFMDQRKAWMMQSRRRIKHQLGNVKNGWLYAGGASESLDAALTAELWERYVLFKDAANVLSGIVASNGGRHFVNGEVVVVNTPTDAVEPDTILVVPSTSPSYVPLMRKAKALITDHGGMMSHAAIVAREFGLPCIVGTKHATQVLKDGDKVVLDLVKGEVNK